MVNTTEKEEDKKMGKVNEGREFKTRVYQGYNDTRNIMDLNNIIVHPYRAEYRVHKTNTDEFSSYLKLVLVPIMGVSDYRTRITNSGEYDRYQITMNVEDEDMKIIDTFLCRLCRGIESCNLGKVFKIGLKAVK